MITLCAVMLPLSACRINSSALFNSWPNAFTWKLWVKQLRWKKWENVSSFQRFIHLIVSNEETGFPEINLLCMRLQESTISRACETTNDNGEPTSAAATLAWFANENFLRIQNITRTLENSWYYCSKHFVAHLPPNPTITDLIKTFACRWDLGWDDDKPMDYLCLSRSRKLSEISWSRRRICKKSWIIKGRWDSLDFCEGSLVNDTNIPVQKCFVSSATF